MAQNSSSYFAVLPSPFLTYPWNLEMPLPYEARLSHKEDHMENNWKREHLISLKISIIPSFYSVVFPITVWINNIDVDV